MQSGGRFVVAFALLALTACNSGVELGRAPTTTTSAPTTTTTVASPKATAKPASTRKATPTTAARQSAPPSLPAGAEEEGFVIEPEHIRPFLLQPGSEWIEQPGEQSGAGPVDLDRAATEEVDEGEDASEARKFLEDIGFMAGYAGAWNRKPEAGTRDDTALYVSLYFFSTPQGADAYLKHDEAAFEESTDSDDFEPISVPDIPGSRAWTGGNDDDGHVTAVLFRRENFYAKVVCFSSFDRYGRGRTWATDSAVAQYNVLT